MCADRGGDGDGKGRRTEPKDGTSTQTPCHKEAYGARLRLLRPAGMEAAASCSARSDSAAGCSGCPGWHSPAADSGHSGECVANHDHRLLTSVRRLPQHTDRLGVVCTHVHGCGVAAARRSCTDMHADTRLLPAPAPAPATKTSPFTLPPSTLLHSSQRRRNAAARGLAQRQSWHGQTRSAGSTAPRLATPRRSALEIPTPKSRFGSTPSTFLLSPFFPHPFTPYPYPYPHPQHYQHPYPPNTPAPNPAFPTLLDCWDLDSNSHAAVLV